MQRTVIGIMGPINVGKSWLCRTLEMNWPEIDFIESIKTSHFVFDKFRDELPSARVAINCDEYKQTWIPEIGKLGRDALIDFIETRRKPDPTWLARQIWQVIQRKQRRYILVDAFGNEPEYQYYVDRIRDEPDMDYIHVNIGCQYYAHGQRYEGDSRSHVEVPWAYRYFNSSEALADLQKSIQRARDMAQGEASASEEQRTLAL